MNKERRVKLKEAIEIIERGKDIVEDVKFDEEFAFDNLSEGLQATTRGQTMEECIDYMDEAIEKLEEAIEGIKDCVTA